MGETKVACTPLPPRSSSAVVQAKVGPCLIPPLRVHIKRTTLRQRDFINQQRYTVDHQQFSPCLLPSLIPFFFSMSFILIHVFGPNEQRRLHREEARDRVSENTQLLYQSIACLDATRKNRSDCFIWMLWC